MRSEVLNAAARKNLFFSPDALEVILSNSDPMAFTNTVLNALSGSSMFIDKKDIMDLVAGDIGIAPERKAIVPHNKRHHDISIVQGTDVTGDSTCEGKITDFATYFKNRFFALKKIIEKRRDFGTSLQISRAMSLGREAKIIGMVYEKKETKNGHTTLTLEDESGTCTVLISKDSACYGELFVNDEVVGVSGRPASRGDLFIADKIFRPDVPTGRTWTPSDSAASVAFLSDIHVGSSTFLEREWKRMIAWMNANAFDMSIDYLVLPGDVVDGIGIFPDQEDELDIADIYMQYEKLGEYIKEIPDHIKIVLQPGNHDAVRLAEPQPALSGIFTKSFDSNVIVAGNPVNIEIEGRTVLSYHGKSIDDWVANVQRLSYDDPITVMKEMLTRRHLSPMYGGKTAMAPEKKDYLVVEKVPDIFVSGHVHGAGKMDHRGTKIINASAWQDQTEYQKSHNFNPIPAIMPVVHLGTGAVRMMDFSK
ncbi:DNA polymerase II small subunit [Candidatus Methanoplasma termitum]|uniref:DNA polymerase II small subunit n=1 Tax=Candidatus Methanoplasma termitum TaxID=1577791 RepID=A0A0A7LHY4_9ARCH|nr:DNA-directed DNA polymerase II small subunit [Candidatus Methanoplasma termitum]AIZ57086.1 DNA polymerase II small subunit [Candidatus Methanoplasma termitum]MCL2333744.1 DNA-directed DNA polymerase II small subunit [Candidatus Methanoplasma sp.]